MPFCLPRQASDARSPVRAAGALVRDYDLHFITLALTEAGAVNRRGRAIEAERRCRHRSRRMNWSRALPRRYERLAATTSKMPCAAWLINDVDAVAIFARHQH